MPSDTSSGPKRSADQIEADIAKTRAELAETLEVLADRVNPRLQAARAADLAQATAASVSERARAVTASASTSVKGFADDVADGKPKAIALVAAGAAVVAALVVVTARRRG